jgi:hypothetical protein
MLWQIKDILTNRFHHVRKLLSSFTALTLCSNNAVQIYFAVIFIFKTTKKNHVLDEPPASLSLTEQTDIRQSLGQKEVDIHQRVSICL